MSTTTGALVSFVSGTLASGSGAGAVAPEAYCGATFVGCASIVGGCQGVGVGASTGAGAGVGVGVGVNIGAGAIATVGACIPAHTEDTVN